jgi:hypothetical protein
MLIRLRHITAVSRDRITLSFDDYAGLYRRGRSALRWLRQAGVLFLILIVVVIYGAKASAAVGIDKLAAECRAALDGVVINIFDPSQHVDLGAVWRSGGANERIGGRPSEGSESRRSGRDSNLTADGVIPSFSLIWQFHREPVDVPKHLTVALSNMRADSADIGNIKLPSDVTSVFESGCLNNNISDMQAKADIAESTRAAILGSGHFESTDCLWRFH